MAQPNYALAEILPYVRRSLANVKAGEKLTYEKFVENLWSQLNAAGVPGAKPHSPIEVLNTRNQLYAYGSAPAELVAVSNEAFFHVFTRGYIVPMGTVIYHPMNHPMFIDYTLTPRGIAWASGDDPLPEDIDGYMKLVKQRAPRMDAVIEQYIKEALLSFGRDAYFATAVMVGAASEKAVYLLADAMKPALKTAKRQQVLQQLLDRRKLFGLLDFIRQTIESNLNTSLRNNPASDGIMNQLPPMFDAIRVQRNEAVHPQRGTVSPESVRFTLANFPAFFAKSEDLREWMLKNLNSLD
jgi:hypothetical protein